MRHLTQIPLDDDIIYALLSHLPDFTYLPGILLCCKSIYNVYKSHPRSIRHAITKNITGPSFELALQLMRLRLGEPEPEERFQSSDCAANVSQANELQEIARVVNDLENVFSWRQKDRYSKMTQLSAVESFRFQRAMYRIWLYTTRTNPRTLFSDPIDLDSERKTYLSRYSTLGLLEIERAYKFLICLFRASTPFTFSGSEHDTEYVLVFGPDNLLHCHGETSPHPVASQIYYDGTGYLNRGYMSSPISQIFADRKFDSNQVDYVSQNVILVESIEDKCERCDTFGGYDLFNDSNWDTLGNFFPRSVIPNLAKGFLPSNESARTLIENLVKNDTFSFESFMAFAYDTKNEAGPLATWQSRDWLCKTCVGVVITEHLHLWALASQTQDDPASIKENCWYGYDCRTQTHRREHAEKLNHLCEPTRGDSVRSLDVTEET